jgi:hypothetical protein
MHVHTAGEIGQVGKTTYLHGFTAAVGILRQDTVQENEVPAAAGEQGAKEAPDTDS